MSTLEIQRRSQGRTRRFVTFFFIGCCAALMVVVAPLLAGSRSVTDSSDSAPPDFVHAAPISEGEPCAEAKPVSMTSLQSQSKGVTVRLPDEKAVGSALSGALFCGGSEAHPVVVVGESIWVFYETGYPESERDAWFAQLAKDYGGKVTSFRGASAYVSPSTEIGVRSQIILSVPTTQEIIRIQAPHGVDIQALERVAGAFDIAVEPAKS